MNFAAVEMLPGESAGHIVKAVAVEAASRKHRFAKLEVFATFTLLRGNFLRFRTDLDRTKLAEVLEALLSSGRGVVYAEGSAFQAKLPSGRAGSVPLTMMTSIAAPGFGQIYRGPAIQFWERQFERM